MTRNCGCFRKAFAALQATVLLVSTAMALQSESGVDKRPKSGARPVELVAPFWNGDGVADSEIEIGNLSEWPKQLWLEAGSGNKTEAVVLAPFGSRSIPLSRLVGEGADSSRVNAGSAVSSTLIEPFGRNGFWDTATIRTTSPRDLVARVRIRNTERGDTLDLPFTDSREVWSNELSSVLWPTGSARASLMIKNLSPAPVELELTADLLGRSITTKAVLEGNGEKTFDLEEFLPHVRFSRLGETASLPVGIRIRHDGSAGAVMAWGLLIDGAGPRLALPFSDPMKRFGNLLYHPAVMFGAVTDTATTRTSLSPYILLYNSSATGGTVRVRASLSEDSAETWQVGPVYMRPRSVSAVKLSPPGRGRSFSGIGAIVIEHDGDPSAISGWLAHLDQESGIASQAALTDPISRVANSVGAAGVSLSDQSTAIVAASNITEVSTQVSLRLFHRSPQGEVASYTLPWRRVGPGENVVIDLRDLRGSPDVNGNPFPERVDSASVKFVSSEINAVLAAFIGVDSGSGGFGIPSHYSVEPVGRMRFDPPSDRTYAPQDFFCTGTTSCSYYDVLCESLPVYHGGKYYYCGPGKIACENIGAAFGFFGLTTVENCIRKCLQVNDDCVYLYAAPAFGLCINALHGRCYGECFFNPFCYVDIGGGGGEEECFVEECPEGFGWSELECQCVPLASSPILLSERGNQLRLTNAVLGVNFDLDADGHAERTAWTVPGGGAAFLALDRDGNGTVDGGVELFGDHTPQPPSSQPNGFEALAVFDGPSTGGNSDGLITAADSIFSQLILWTDDNHDGISQPSEMRSLQASGVAAIRLSYHESRRTDQFGNQFRFFSRVEMEHVPGSPATLSAVDVFFVGLAQF